MGVAAILGMWPRPHDQTYVPPSHWGSIWNLALIGQAILEKKFFENGGRRTDDVPWLYYKLTNEPKGSGELKKTCMIPVFQPYCKKVLDLMFWNWPVRMHSPGLY